MNREAKLAQLKLAEQTIARGEQHLGRQEQIVAELDRDGHDTREALEFLAMFRRLQADHIAHRDLLLKQLQSGV